MNDGHEQVVREFLIEAGEIVAQLDRDLLNLERSPEAGHLITSAFRAFHTLKGSGGMLGFHSLETVSHEAENLLSAWRDRNTPITSAHISALLGVVDWVRRVLTHIAHHGDEGTEPVEPVLESLMAYATPAAASATVTVVTSAEPSESSETDTRTVISPAIHNTTNDVAERTIRVDIGLLDRLMTLVGELVLARNQIVQSSAARAGDFSAGATQRLNQITADIQEAVMKARMQPISTVWNRIPRMVRDLAHANGKKIRIDVDGGATELDRSLIETIKDPLIHLVRNAVDHGVEMPEVRTQRGKPVEGRITLRAYHEHSQVTIEIKDDGAGIDLDRVRDTALRRQLVTPTAAERMSDRDWVDMLFRPGFSTAGAVTALSGRGVGLDVVRANIERIGGTIDLQTEFGRGTTMRLKIPLTLAIMPSLVVSSGGEQYAIPQLSVLELVRLSDDEESLGIESIHGTPVYRLRGQLLPLLSLSHELGNRGATPFDGREVGAIVVLQAGQRSVGLIVDAVHDTEEIVVKPLGKHLRGNPLFAGATILSDGRVALILDVRGLVQGIEWADDTAETARKTAAVLDAEHDAEIESVLVVEVGDGGRMAFPLDAISRLEQMPSTAIERIGGQEVVQYRGDIMPLVRLVDLLPERRQTPRGSAAVVDYGSHVWVVVHATAERRLGIVVPRVIDIVSESTAVCRPPTRAGVRMSTVIQQRVTEWLDVPALLGRAEATALALAPMMDSTPLKRSGRHG